MKHTRSCILPALLLCSACDLPGWVGETPSNDGDLERAGAARIERTSGPAGRGGLDVSGPGDIDGDGYADLVVSFAGTDETAVCWFFGSEDGLPPVLQSEADRCINVDNEPGLTITHGIGMWPIRPMPLGDIDGDGIRDLGIWAAQAGQDSRLYVFRGGPEMRTVSSVADASGTLVVGLGEDYQAWPVSPADINGDGTPDLVMERWFTEQPSPQLAHVPMRSLWAVPSQALLSSGTTDYGLPVSLGEFQSEDYFSVAVSESAPTSGAVVITTNSASSGFGYHNPLASRSSDRIGVDEYFRDVAIVDANCDGAPELLGTTSDGLFSHSLGTASTELRLELVDVSAHGIDTPGDLDGDGCHDLVLTMSAGEFPQVPTYHALIVYGGAELQAGERLELPRDPRRWGYRPISTAGDLNGDGHDDFFIEFDGNFVNEVYEEGILTEDSVLTDDPVDRVILYYGGARPPAAE